MSIEIELRGVRWRSVGRPLRVETAADRRMRVAGTCLPAGQTLRPVLPKRSDQRSSAGESPDAAGRITSNLRAETLGEAKLAKHGSRLTTKD